MKKKSLVAGLVSVGLVLGMPGIALAETSSESASSETTSTSTSKSEGKGKGKDSDDEGGKCVIALDPGHNVEKIEEYDEKTGVFQYDYPNGKEDKDVWEVSMKVAKSLKKEGYKPVILRKEIDESVDYRSRVDRAEKVKADLAVSVHTTPGTDYSMIIAQKEGGYREGKDADGEEKRVEFEAGDVAEKSKELSEAVAKGRSDEEPNPVKVVEEHSFDGRDPMWGGNTPILSLMSENVPWLYSEFGTDEGGGEEGISKEQRNAYAKGLTKGLLSALEGMDCGGGSDGNGDGDDDDGSSSSSTSAPSGSDSDSGSGSGSTSSTAEPKGKGKGSDEKKGKSDDDKYDGGGSS